MRAFLPPSGEETRPPAEPPREWTRTATWPHVLMVLAVFAVTFGLRVYRLGPTWDIHVDELTYLNISQTVLERLQVRLYGEAFYLHPPAYFFLEALALKILHPVGDVIQQIYAARYLNVFLGALSAVLLYLIGQRLAGWKAGLTAAALFALDPFAVQTNSRTLLETSAVFWVLLGLWLLFRAAQRGHFRRRDIVGTGLAFGLALLTKDMLVFLTLLPLGVCLLGQWVVPRRVAGWTFLTAVLTYLPYPLTVVLVGDGRLFLDEKFSGLSRFLGTTKTTGFKRTEGPSLTQALADNLQTFGTTYLLVVVGVVAVVLLWRGRTDQPLRRLLALWVSSAYVLLGFAVLIGTLEEQFFYYLTVPVMLAVSVAYWSWRSAQSETGRRRSATAFALVAAVFGGWTLWIWTGIHLNPSNGYQTLRAYLSQHVPRNSRISTLTQESVFLTRGYSTGVWKDPAALQNSQVQYVILSTQQVARGYGYATPALKTWLDDHARLLTSVPSRSYGRLNLYRLPAAKYFGEPSTEVARGRAGWYFLPSEYLADPATLNDPSSAGAYAADTMTRIGRLLREKHQAMQILLIPAKFRIYPAFLPDNLPLSSAIEQRYARTLQALRHSGLLAPNLLASFQAAAARPDAAKLFLKQDHHWTPQGAQVAAIAAARNLSGQVDLSDLPAVTATSRTLPDTDSIFRSLYHFLPATAKQQVQPEQYRPIQVQIQQAGNAGLLGDDTPGVVLVGSSFSAIAAFSFAPLLEQQLGHEVLNVSDSAKGSWAPMLSYFRTSTYQDTPPHLVIWEFWENFLNNQGVGTVPFAYLLNAAANIVNSCPETGVALASGHPNPGTASIDIAVLGSAHPLGDYLHLQFRAPGQRILRGEFLSDGPAHPFSVPLTGDAEVQNVNIPVYSVAGYPTQGVRLFTDAPASAVMQPQLCHLPSYISDPSYSKLGHLDLLQNSAPSGTQLTGLGEIESTGFRWGVGPETAMAFFSATNRNVHLAMKFRAPVTGQALKVSMNGETLADRRGLYKGDVTTIILTLKARAGLNTLTLTPALENRGANRFSPADPRPTTVEFTQFQLDDQ